MKSERYFILDGLKSVSLLHIRFGFHFFLSFVLLVQQIEFINSNTVVSSRRRDVSNHGEERVEVEEAVESSVN